GEIMGMEAGAVSGNMESYWGSGAMVDPDDVDSRPTFDDARAAGGTVILNASGDRFVNEAAPYHDFAKAFGAFDASESRFPNEVAWMVFDEGVRSRKAVLSMRPDGPVPDWVVHADTVGDLAERLGMDRERLAATVAGF